MTNKEAAEKYAREHSNAPDKETPDWIINDFLAGCEHVEKQHREFVLNVRELLTAIHFTNDNEFQTYLKCNEKVKKYLSDFTKRELESLPFKD